MLLIVYFPDEIGVFPVPTKKRRCETVVVSSTEVNCSPDSVGGVVCSPGSVGGVVCSPDSVGGVAISHLFVVWLVVPEWSAFRLIIQM